MKKFVVCRTCGNFAGVINSSKVPMFCCGKPMEVVEPKTTEGNGSEKHLPVVTVEGNKVNVKVGSVSHPMTEEHSILWIYLETTKGGHRINCNGVPEANFILADDEKPVAAYSYCNLHGLWMSAL